MKKLIACLLTLALAALPALAEDVSPAEQAVRDVLNGFLTEDYDAVWQLLDAEAQQAVSPQALEQVWQQQLAALGPYQDAQFAAQGDAAAALLVHENGRQQLTVTLGEDGKVHGLNLNTVPDAAEPAARALPEGVTATAVTLFEGTERELTGELLAPADPDAPYAILIHGSGPSDLNESVGAVQPFRDLAYDLAENGVGSLRFDKITYTHPELGADTVVQEYLEPVTEALRVLRARLDGNRIYALGHSEGGMLMPWLVSECGFDGGAALAGTPKQLWEISYEQNLAILPSLPEAQQASLQKDIEAERARAESLQALDDGETVFGLPAGYLKHMATLDELALAQSCEKPLLFLWGDADFQVSREDFDAWREGLGDGERFAYIVYPGLNHLFMPAQEGDGIASAAQVYARPAQMDPGVARDIAAWMNAD